MPNEPRKVLIVDDDILTARSLKTKFEEEGFEADTADNGRDGIEKITSFAPDVVVLDLVMPVSTGGDLLEQVNAAPPAHMPKFLVLTNHTDAATLEQIFKNDIANYVSKANNTLEDIVALVRKQLGE